MARTFQTAAKSVSQPPSKGGKTPRSTLGGKTPRKTFSAPPAVEPDSASESGSAESETEPDDGDGDGDDDPDLTPTQRKELPVPTTPSDVVARTTRSKKLAVPSPSTQEDVSPTKKGYVEIDSYRKHREALIQEAHEKMGSGNSKFLPNDIRRKMRTQLKRIALPLHSTRRYKIDAASRRHSKNIKHQNLGRKHVERVRQEKRVQEKIRSRNRHQKAAAEFHGRPNTIQVWNPTTKLHPLFCAAQCKVIAEEIPGQINKAKPGLISKGSLIMMRHCPGTKGPDGFIPDAPLFYHVECLTTPMLARLADQAKYEFHAKLPIAQKAIFRTLVDKAVIAMETLPKPVKQRNTKKVTDGLTITAYKRLCRARTQAAANLHKARRNWREHETHLANVRAKALLKTANRRNRGIRRAKFHVEEENKKLRFLNDTKQNAINMYSSLLVQKGRKLGVEKTMRAYTRAERLNVKLIAHNNTLSHFEVISECCRAMRSSPKLRKAYVTTLNKIKPGLADSHMLMLEMFTDRPPEGFLTAGSNAPGRTFRTYFKSVLEDPDNFDDIANNAAKLEAELEELGRDMEKFMAEGSEDPADSDAEDSEDEDKDEDELDSDEE